MPDNYLDLADIMKAGINATDVQLDGELTPAQGRAFANAIVDNSQILKRITVDITGKLTKKRSALDAAKGVLARHISGEVTDTARYASLGVIGAQLNMTRAVVLEAQINQETLDDNQDNKGFEAEQHAGFTQMFSNELVYLGMVGIADNDLATAPFNELAKGWPFVAAESADTVKKTSPVVLDNAQQTVLNALDVVVKNAHRDIRNKMAIFLSVEDHETYVDYIADKHQNTAVLLSGEAARFKGRELIVDPDMAKGTYLGTPLKNMVLGLARTIMRTRWYDNDKSALRYKFIVRPDYEFDIKKYVTLVTEV
ncbi:MAG TPA: hypothetical protein EYP80_02040 [Candidatus Aenigmarchaeota archaeon]|nr:hypothetical protein [Candidatus Aenigmarchaeota archaeon]